jgi:serpin B
LGVDSAFDSSRADFSGIAGEKGELTIGGVLQKTFIDVSENGVEAAAATVVG